MMRPSNDLAAVYVCIEPVDFRKQINGLAALVQEVLALDPFSEQLFVFTNRRRDRVKCLYWERSGFVLWMKRLERERFHWPQAHGATVTLSGQELNWLLDGFDLSRWRPHQRLHYDFVA
jgi:transposase